MKRIHSSALAVNLVALLVACSGSDPSPASGSSGGTTAGMGGNGSENGAGTETGGVPATGATTAGTQSSVGGTLGVGGITASSVAPTGGSIATSGGFTAAGGASTGGKSGAGGTTATGTTKATGGATATGGSTNSGACSTGPGTPFPAIASYTARDGGFGPAEVTRRTSDASMGTNTVAIFRPAAAKYGQGGVRHPLIVWGNGSTNTVDIWAGFLSRVATYGFVVVAPEQTQVTADHMNQAIDYALRLANDSTSGDCGKIDATKIGSTGYSLGGMGAITVGSNARITSTFFFASNGNVRNLKSPWGVIGGDADTIFSFPAITTTVTGSTQPAFGAALAGINHNGVAGQPKAQEGYIGWMRWRFMGDQAGHDLFVGPSCQICSDAAFSGVVKTSTFDAL